MRHPIRLITLPLLVASLALTAGTVMADTRAQETERRASEGADTRIERRAEAWGLSVEEWERYESLMAGQRGLWSPDLDPIMVLGIHARSESERRRYAEMAVEQERARVEGELAFQRAYDDAWRRLYPDEALIDESRLASSPAPLHPSSSEGTSRGDRLLLFTRTQGCSRCDALLDEVIVLADERDLGLDIYLLDTEPGDETTVRAWAAQHEIPTRRVQQRRITLNHDNGTARRLGVRSSAPVLLHRTREGATHAIGPADLR
ncbi:TIGR03759 family integrating conjugative element protein [Ectothiorhodospira variabilis]|uniref:TIGR03759 family integrating conjugative element protein n=1 Tax=Ectothiorhodospira variabilis TaxID=505694 RepID=UPI001EFBAB26|nr:TIGR03759 family integrating conjugative element protein [Ectothiorhodospira variabilis]MCG5495549.1 TIGR03759 family integrating conjugative element protein [Ectothiorhodospira variabilis]MCG5505157.1 TIGR03759 family integrating conjugative element protein [Ectothiorhodospira variabilis]MCG5508314.1 TIGR03759 family integrating conjugative element protein [Ectothiorhodospira variabilis]